MMYVRFPLSLRQVEDMLSERGIDICHETVRFWWNRFGPMFAAEIRKRRLHHRSFSQWRWHLDEVFVRINGEKHYLWRAVDHEGEVLEVFARHCQSKFVYFAKTSEPDFAAIDFPAFFRVDLSGSMAAPSI
jgi:putative transposase